MLFFFLFTIHYPSQKVTIIYKQKHSLVREKMSTHCNLEVVSFSLPPHNQYTHYGFCDLGPLYTFFLSVKCVFHTVLWWNDQYTTVNFNQSLTVLASPDCPNRQLPQIFFLAENVDPDTDSTKPDKHQKISYINKFYHETQ